MAYAYQYGTGTSTDPYQVFSVADLQGVADYPTSFFIQKADIDLTGISWTPICGTFLYGGTDPGIHFNGTYDGNNFKITNLNVNLPNNENVGLFGNVNGGTLKNISIIGATINGYSNVGTLTGELAYSSTTNCLVKNVTITQTGIGAFPVGGFAGSIDNATITSKCGCLNPIIDVKTDRVGGFAGVMVEGTMSECFCAATYPNGRNYIGYYNGTTREVGEIYDTSGRANDCIGGLIGYLQCTTDDTIVQDCYTKNLYIRSGTSPVASFVGYGTIVIQGNINYYRNYVSNKGTTAYGFYMFSGGYYSPGYYSYNYFDTTVQPFSSDSIATGLTQAQLQSQSSYVGFNFNTTWGITAGKNDGYAYLKWQTWPVPKPNLTAVQDGTHGDISWTYVGVP